MRTAQSKSVGFTARLGADGGWGVSTHHAVATQDLHRRLDGQCLDRTTAARDRLGLEERVVDRLLGRLDHRRELLFEFLLFAWQFHNWKNILRVRWLYLLLTIGMTMLWITENIILGRITMFSPVFQISYSLALILLAVNQLSWLVVNDRGRIMANPVFIISIAVIIFFSYKVLTEIFYYYAASASIKNNIFVIESYLNVGYNIMLTIAIICIPPKRNFIQL